MDDTQFREAMNRAKREDRLLWVADDSDFGIAVGLDSGRRVAILHDKTELPLAGLREIKPV